jgi:hypothetical protein
LNIIRVFGQYADRLYLEEGFSQNLVCQELNISKSSLEGSVLKVLQKEAGHGSHWDV